MIQERTLLTGRALSWPAVVTICLAALGAASVIWLIAVPIGPEACALSMPGPRNCFTFDRVQAAMLPTLAIAAVAVASIALAVIRPRRSRAIAVVSVLVLLIVAVVSYVLVAWIPALAWVGRPGIGLG